MVDREALSMSACTGDDAVVRRFDGRVALVTGGGSGIGAAAARRLAGEGAHVVVTGRRRGPIDAIAAAVDGLAVPGDVTDPAHLRAAVAATTERWGRLDVVVVNAGAVTAGAILDTDTTEWDRTMATNVTGAVETIRAALPAMLAGGGGAIVGVASVAALVAGPASAAYACSKAALVTLMRSIAVDYGRWGIRANTICPGWVITPMSEGEMGTLGDSVEEGFATVSRHLPLGRVATVDEIAACIAFLASDDASFVTGSVLVADGGGAAVDVGMLAFADP